VPPERLWSALADTSRYPEWFPWLHAYDAGPLQAGTTARFVVRPPLPYRLTVAVDVHRVEEGSVVEGTVGGDLAGPARLEVSPDGEGSAAHLTWEVELTRPSLRRLERVARPAMVWGHDTVVAVGLRRFRRRALG
jgi:uncharacterized protein YndB with AHSA1/START domain